ncbi:MAG: riboflavin kinase [Mycoplasmoidaceae bacterium]
MKTQITIYKPKGLSTAALANLVQSKLAWKEIFYHSNLCINRKGIVVFSNNLAKLETLKKKPANNVIAITDLWKYQKNVVLLNGLKKINFKITNLLIGEFDLIHKGHLQLLLNDDLTILTFLNNPGKQDLVLDINAKIDQLQKFQPKKIIVYDIKEENLEAETFLKKYLKMLNPKQIYVGSHFHFGKNGLGDISLLASAFNVTVIPRNQAYATSNVKQLIKANNFQAANKILYQEFSFEGIIIKGKQLGRKLGYPTANVLIKTNYDFNLGSYGTKCLVNNQWYDSISFFTTSNDQLLMETHIFNFNKNIYGQRIKVIPLFFIRKPEQFINTNELIKNIKKDVAYAMKEREKYGK